MYVIEKDKYIDSSVESSLSNTASASNRLPSDPVIIQMLESFPELVFILDSNLQIVASNHKAKELVQKEEGSIIGKHLGDVFGCIHALETEEGCGTSAFCPECGARKSCRKTMLTSQLVEEECRIFISNKGFESSLDLKVLTSVLEFENQKFIVFSIRNLENEKRRELLERIFFHDVLNTASIIFGLSGMLSEVRETEDFEKYTKVLLNTSEQLIQEIQAQRDLSNAESGKLVIYPAMDTANNILEKAFDLYGKSNLTKEKTFKCEYPPEMMIIETDPHFIIRSLGNLIKNALEAIGNGQTVTISAQDYGDNVRFVIANDGVIPKHIQLQIFNRSFSTKAKKGRGIGTYSVKLLIENYLKGKVSFISNEEEQTKFIIEIPKRFPE